MSTTVDQRVVEMQFDNRHFEQNVQTSMSTLEKLKKSLKLEDAAKGFDNVSSAAKKVDMSGLGNGVENVRMKFSALEVMGVTALANITNSAVNAGKRIVSALTIQPITTGFSEYETKMGSIQTILANTSHAGTTLEQVTSALNELNLYADKTIYNFAQMTKNIGTFTAAGVDLDTSVRSIQGIANLAAVSGSTSQQASTAMYQLSQALAAGTVKLMDWNSVVNAGMGGKVFQDALVRTAAMLAGQADDVAAWQKAHVDKYGSFRESLTKEAWLTTEVLTTTLEQFTMAAEEGSEEWEKYKKSLMDQGYSEAQAKAILKMANTATDAATKVKTFTQLWDTLKETAQSGWAQTWEIIVGDFYEAQDFLTKISDTVGGFLNSMSEWRNNLLGGALGSNWDKLVEKINDAGIETVDFEEAVHKALKDAGHDVDALLDKHKSLEEIFTSGAVSADVLKKAVAELTGATGDLVDTVFDLTGIDRLLGFGTVGDDVKKVQTALEKLGYTLDKFGVDGIIGDETTAAIKKFQADNNLQVDGVVGPETLAALEKAGKKTSELTDKNKKLVESYDDLINAIEKKSGRELLIESLSNACSGLISIFKALGQAWVEIFPPMTVDQLYNIIEGINGFSQHLKMSDETADNLKRTFKGVFAIVDIVATIFGGGLRIAFKILSSILGFFNLDILEFTALIGDALVKVRDWFDGLFDVSGILEVVVPWVVKCAKAIGNWFRSLKDTKLFKQVNEYLGNMVDKIREWFKSFDAATAFKSFIKFLQNGISAIRNWFNALYESDSVAGDIIRGLANGLRNGFSEAWDAAVELAKNIWEAVKDFLGIHSPSTKFIEIGKNIIDGLIEGLRWGVTKIMETFSAVIDPVIEWINGLDLGKIFSIALAIGSLWFLKQIGDLVGGLGRFLGSMEEISTAVKKVGKSLSLALKAEAMKAFATSLLILVAAIAILTLLDVGKMWSAVGALVVIMGALAGLIFLMGKVPAERTIAPFGVMMLSLAGAMLGLALLCKIIAPIEWGDLGKAAAALGVLAVLIGALIFVATKISTNIKTLAALAKLGDMMLKIGLTVGIIAIALKIIADIPSEGIWQAVGVLAAIGGLVGVLIVCVGVANLLSKNAVNDFGKIMISIGASILMLAIALKIITDIPKDKVWHAFGVLTAITVLVGGLMVLTGFVNGLSKNKKAMTEFGNTMLGIGAAFLMITVALKIITTIPEDQVWHAFGVLAAVSGLVVALMLFTNLAPKKKIANTALTLLAMAGCIAILAAICVVLGLVDPSTVWKGIAAVAALSVLVGGLIWVTKQAKDIKGTLTVLAIVIALLAGAIIGLSFIEPKKLYSAVGAMAILMGMFSLMTVATKKVSKTYSTFIVLGAVVALMGGVLAGMSALKTKDAIPNAIALGSIMLAMAGVLKIISKINKTQLKNATSAMTALTAMVVPMIAFAAAIRGIQAMGINESVVTPLLVIGAAIAAMAVLLVPLTAIGKLGSWQSLIGFLALTAMVAPLLAFAGAIRWIQEFGIDSSVISTILMLAQLMTAMTVLLIPLTIMGMAGLAPFVGMAALTSMMIPLLAFAKSIEWIGKMKIGEGLPFVKDLVALMDTMTTMLIKVSLVAPLALMAVGAIGALVGVITAFGVIAGAVGTLVDKFPQLEEFIDIGIPIMEKLAEGVGSILGKFITGFATEVISLIPTMGTALSDFLENAEYFIDNVGDIDESAVTGVGYLAGAIALLTAAEFLDNITSFMGLGEGFVGLGTKLSDFIEEVIPAFEALQEAGLSPETITSVKTLAEALLLLTGTELLDQISNLVFGQTNEESFSTGMVSLADGLKAFGEASADLDLTKIQNGIDALMMLIEASEAVPDQEWYVKLFPWGRGDEAVFGDGLASLGSGINAFATSCADIDADSVTGGINALKELIAASEAIPDADWYTKLCPWGRDNNAVFGNGLSQLGAGISAFATSCADINADSVTGGCDALNALISAASAIPDATWYEKIIPWANSDEAVFGSGLATLGAGIADFATNCDELDPEIVTSGASALVSLSDAAANIPDATWYEKIIPWAESDEEVFGEGLKVLGNGLKSFYNNVNSIENFDSTKMDSMTSALSAVVKLANSGVVSKETSEKWQTALASLGTGLYDFYSKGSQIISEDLVAGVDEVFSSVKEVTNMVKTTDISGTHANLELLTSALENLLAIDASSQTITEAITSIADINIEALSTACASIVETMGTIAEDMVDSFVSGVDSNMSTATDACSSMAEACATAISDYDFSSAGADVVTGFAAGITDNTWRAEAKARAMAKAAEDAAKDELDINSPSKVFRAIGTSVPEGFAQGIGKLGSMVRGSARSMADTAVDSVKNTISNLASIVSSDIDTQPTIRPVMDLSGVRLGAAAIDGMLNSGSMLGVTANVGAVNSMMNRRIQNGVSNHDMLSEMKLLRKDLANVGRPSYTVNGITYDDGTNISTAVKDLIRAARIERRV